MNIQTSLPREPISLTAKKEVTENDFALSFCTQPLPCVQKSGKYVA